MNRDPEVWARLGQALANTRQARGLRQEDVAEQADVSLKSVQSAEAGVVPKARMPYTVPAIARALGWPDGAVDTVLDGGAPPGGWSDVSVQKQVDAERLEADLTHAYVRSSDSATGAEIKAATKAALDVLRQHGLI
ncbi:helix-turn-helix domain-containing protein [Streptomyces sp. NPDC057217]|uniref:helix-turn-helix domain-containing protein n=1 Tax=Streptomyces sp. NPDC057217 TaxID=3346054 RepID=UPI003635CF0C